MKGIYVSLLLVVAVFAARSASQQPATKTKSGPPPRRGGAPARAGHPAVMSRLTGRRGGAGRGAPPKRAGGEAELEREGARRRKSGRRGSARASAPPAVPAAPAAPVAPAAPAPPAPPARSRPCVIAPVCGSDGYTYMSECYLWAGVVKSCDGLCPCAAPAPVQPPRAYPPARRANPPPPRRAPAPPKPRARPPSCNCPEAWAPVCGANGQTYDNDCMRRCSFVGLACQGTCPCNGGRRKQSDNVLTQLKPRSGTRARQQQGNKNVLVEKVNPRNTKKRKLKTTNTKQLNKANINTITTNQSPQNTNVSSITLSKKTQRKWRKGIPVSMELNRGSRTKYDVVGRNKKGKPNYVGNKVNPPQSQSRSRTLKARGRSIQGSGRRGSSMITRPRITNIHNKGSPAIGMAPNSHQRAGSPDAMKASRKSKSGSGSKGDTDQRVSSNVNAAADRHGNPKVTTGPDQQVDPIVNVQRNKLARQNTRKVTKGNALKEKSANRISGQNMHSLTIGKSGSNRNKTSANPNRVSAKNRAIKDSNKVTAKPKTNDVELKPNKYQAYAIELSREHARRQKALRKSNKSVRRRPANERRPRKKQRCLCPGNYKQVCGVNGKTYKNECRMKCFGVQKACDTACPCSQPAPPKCEDSCPGKYSPCCSADGITYDNDCLLRCSGKAKSCDGMCPCPTTPRPMVCEDYCPSAYSPVCTVDGNTYGNDCRRRCSGKPKACDKACPCPTPAPPKCEDLCPRSYKLVCDINGKTHNTDCLRRCSGIPKDCDGRCPCRPPLPVITPAPVSCESQCLQDYTPVCSQDGKTFKNDCLRKCSGKLKGCDKACPCRKASVKLTCEDYCIVEYEAVCGVDGTTYDNDCMRKCSGAARACDGPCPCPFAPPRVSCEDKCPRAYEPVCTVDSNTFNNDCLRNCSGKAKRCDGLCPCRRSCVDYCPLEYKPQCGTDGNTHNNECLRGCSGVPKQCNGACPCPPPAPPKTCEDYCSNNYKPVCTVYGNTYHNDCLRSCSGEQRQCEGSCPCEVEGQSQVNTFTCKQQCWWDRDPVCTTDGDTIWSGCEAMCDYVGLACEGPCPCGSGTTLSPWLPAVPAAAPAPDCGCSPFEIDPVCTGEQTIWNGCQAICEGAEIKCSSECPC